MTNNKYIYVKKEKVYVSNEIYKEYKKCINRENYLRSLDRKYRVYDYDLDLNSVEDERVNIEKIIETEIEIEHLYKALEKLDKKEIKIIESLYFKEMTIRELAAEENVSAKKIFNLRNKILAKLRNMLK